MQPELEPTASVIQDRGTDHTVCHLMPVIVLLSTGSHAVDEFLLQEYKCLLDLFLCSYYN